MQRTTPIAVALGLLLCAVIATPASAQFPGGNGRIALASRGSGDIVTFNDEGKAFDVLIKGGQNSGAAWSPGGTRIAFTRAGQIWIADAGGTNAHQVSTSSITHSNPSWSPDGLQLVFNAGGNLWTIGADGTGETQLTSDSLPEVRPSWSPDGTTIVFQRYDADTGKYKLFLIDSTGTNLRQLTEGANSDTDPNWHPTGSKILFWRDLGSKGGALRTIAPDGTNPALVAKDDNYFAAEWSPDGKKIVAVTGTPFDRSISVLRADGSGKQVIRSISRDQLLDGGPSWRPIPPP